MMDAVNLPTGLIKYASENSITNKQPYRFTGRMKAYTAVMVLLLCVEGFLLASRTDVGISVLRTPGQLFQQQPNNQLSNLYNYKFLNKTYVDKQLELKPEDFTGTIKLVGEEKLNVPKEGYASGSLFIYIDKSAIKERKTKINIGVFENGKKIKVISTSFLGPFSAN
jgi:polyferredoxin